MRTLLAITLLLSVCHALSGCHELPDKENRCPPDPSATSSPAETATANAAPHSTNPYTCTLCGTCALPDAIARCLDDTCHIERCLPGFADLNADPDDGCEATAPPEPPTPERCDGLDDDADGRVDEDLSPPLAQDLQGICAHAPLRCAGRAGFQPPPLTDLEGYEAIEATCDGRDNDCDGHIDEALGVGDPCQSGHGPCAVDGTLRCGPDGPTCDATPRRPRTDRDTTCDLIDDDCDGETDEDPPCNGTACSHLGGLPEGYVCIPPGTFRMGSPTDEADRESDEPLHRVTLTRTLIMAATELTQDQWAALPGWNNPAHVADAGIRPVERVNVFDAMRWLNARSTHDGLVPCYDLVGCDGPADDACPPDPIFGSATDCHGPACERVTWFTSCDGWRLPTEAEWEHAIRAGTTTAYWCGPDESCVDDAEWHADNVMRYVGQFVGRKRQNPWGLYDMGGNVFEWVFDHYHETYGETVALIDPMYRGPRLTGETHGVVRGSFVELGPSMTRSANRAWAFETLRYFGVGFRPVRTIDP